MTLPKRATMRTAKSAANSAASFGSPSIEAVDLGWTYTGRSRPALAGLNFRLEPGRVLLVLGPSGSGKSTLARALAGLVPHTLPGRWQGSLRIGGLDVAATPARFLGERVGLVFQDPDSQIVMGRVDDEVAFGLENRGWARAEMQARVPEALEQAGLTGFERRGTNTLSGGEKQRLAIADILAAHPSLLVFDEPTANLDPPGMHATLERLAALAERREHTIVLIEHRLEAALPLADYVLLLDDEGRQLAFAPAGSVGPEAVALLEKSGAWVPRAWKSDDAPHGKAEPDKSDWRGGATAPLAPTRQLLLRAENLGFDYPADESGTHPALEGVSLEARAGERIALVGPNGAGKSTLLFLLAGLRRPNRGTVGVREAAGSESPLEDLRAPSRLRPQEIASRIGLVFQDPELGFVARTARDEVTATSRAAMGRRRARVDGRVQGGEVTATSRAVMGRRRRNSQPLDSDGVLARFGLGHLTAQDPFRLSQGEQRRLSLAALVLRPPAVLLLDEPTFGLDRRGTEAVMSLLDEQRATGQAQLLATHDPRLLPRCDRVVALDHGRIVFDGTPDEFLANPPYSPAGPWRDGAGPWRHGAAPTDAGVTPRPTSGAAPRPAALAAPPAPPAPATLAAPAAEGPR
ncbi:MAG TPA: ATP-binding cassette domain-containing protein [Candidatus Limnocylindrales bacterium]